MENHHRSSTSHDIWSDGTPSAPMSTIFFQRMSWLSWLSYMLSSPWVCGCLDLRRPQRLSQPNIFDLKHSSEERSPAKTKKLDLHFPQRNSDWASLWLKNVLYLEYWKHACPKGMHFRIWVVHALTPNQALASQTGNCLKLMGNQWMLDKLVISCSFWTTDNSNGSPTSFPKHLTPGFPYAWATLVVFFLKSCREQQVITQIPVETCYLSYLSTLEQSSSTNKITPRTKKTGPRSCVYLCSLCCLFVSVSTKVWFLFGNSWKNKTKWL